MPQIEWPTRHAHCSTSTGAGGIYFQINPSDRDSIVPGSIVRYVSGGTTGTFELRFEGDQPSPHEFSLRWPDGSPYGVNGYFFLEIDVGIIVNYPTRPVLVDPASESVTSLTNPLITRGFTQGEPRYEGSVTLEVGHHADVPIVEAFIDQLYDPEAWFELPLPGDHLTAQNVTAYNAGTGDITMTLASTYGDRNLQGYYARVGARTAKIIYHRRQGITNTHVIRIVPKDLISGTTSADQSNSFSNVQSVRARASNITSTGSADYGAIWTMDWVETSRND